MDNHLIRDIIYQIAEIEQEIIRTYSFGEEATILFSDAHVYKVFSRQNIKRIKQEITILGACARNVNICAIERFNNGSLILKICGHNMIKMKNYHSTSYSIDEKWLTKLAMVAYQMHEDLKIVYLSKNKSLKREPHLQYIHGDLRIENILNTNSGIIVIDFSDSTIGDIEFDIARLVQSLVYAHNIDERLVSFFIEKYQQTNLLDKRKLRDYIRMHGERRYNKDKQELLKVDASYKRLLRFVNKNIK